MANHLAGLRSAAHLVRRAASFHPGSLLIALTVALAGGASAAGLEGSVRDLDGQPVGGAVVTVKTTGLNATTVSTYTASNGQFSFANLGRNKIAATALSMQKVGYLQDGAPQIKTHGQRQMASIRAKRIDNVAGQVPPSAWLANLPDTPAGHAIVLNCAQCHQFPFTKARNYITKFSMLPDEQREKVWYDVMRFMRVKAVSIAPAGLDAGIEKLPLSSFSDDRINGYSHADELAMAPVLTKYMPRSFDTYRLADYAKLLAPVGGPGTVIREYQLPLPAVSMFHDSAITRVNGKLFVYSVDFINYRMTRVDVATGEVRTLPLPKGMIGGHTLVPDAHGNIWATIMISGQLARFDAKSETWTVWDAGKPGGAEFGGGGGGFVHSMAYKAGFEMGFDVNGAVWASLIGTNQLIKLDPKTGKTATVDAPGTNEAPGVGDRTFVSGLYGLVMTADGGHIWATQLEGSVFSVNTKTMQVEDVLPIPRGDGPRRLTIDKNDVIYVPLNGAGQLFVYDTKAKKEIGRFSLPDRAAATYAVNWDAKRNAVWLASGNAAKVYKFDVASTAFTEYPMPRTEGVFIRSLPIDQTTGDIYFSYAPIASLKGPHMVVWLHPDDAEAAKKVAAISGPQPN